ncbi:MAG TPA: hypothetical protein VK047_14965 [Zeimonas sp.]|nr:hypothetical protein [Zeimonas sp.]
MKARFNHLLAAGVLTAVGPLVFAAPAAAAADHAAEPMHASAAHEPADAHAGAAHSHSHAHSHAHDGDGPMLRLDDGRKWATDEALRASMARIGAAVEATLPVVHAGRMNDSQYDALGREIDAQVANIVQNCELEPAADEVLHAILATMLEGNEALQGKHARASRSEGVVHVVRSLEQYADHFEHPGFRAPKPGH